MKSTLLLAAAHILLLHPLFAQVKSVPWLLQGNTGTDTSVNFLGTTDAMPLLLKVNNQKAGFIDYASSAANVGLGYQSLFLAGNYPYSNWQNTAVGYQSLYSNVYGPYNTAVGAYALYSNIGGSNTALGTGALYSNTLGYWNTGTGTYALSTNTTGFGNTGDGFSSLESNTTGRSNTASGTFALYENTTGNFNTADGYQALEFNDAGNRNTAVGYKALRLNFGGNFNTALGSNTGIDGLIDNATAIGAGAKVDASNIVRVGNALVTSIGGQVGWTSFSDARVKQEVKENVPGLVFIKLLRPVTYRFNSDNENTLLGSTDSMDWASKYDIEKIQFTGLIAQEVDAVAQKINYEFSGVDKTGKIWGLRYGDFVVPLVKAVQELSEENDELRERLDRLEALISQQASQRADLSDKAMLEQNIPNPAKGVTTIRYNVPSYVTGAYINVYSSSNAFISSIKIASKGSGSVDLKISELSSGVYQYALIVDEKVVDRKQMVITR